ncbi:MAG: hypothetical protein A2231_11995 [Candidatus Firestonebacteria bacterium RIFOXYA2_FULL_40_8]|nr:MAG: hypothetical protein A2231_11995 [Candidatus Firestonebacteria bacterium RIFOXYA2_FULL_40_8]
MKKAVVRFRGTVQGVGFRFTCRDIAERLGNVTGTVENLSDRSVELVAEGEGKDIIEFLKKIQEYFETYIKSMEIEWEVAEGKFEGFEIK